MSFLFRLASHLGKSVGEIVTGERGPMKAIEFRMWGQYRERFGFDIDRLEHAVANAGTASARAMGASVTPDDLVPKFGRPREPSLKKLAYQLSALPGCQTVFRPRDRTKPVLIGAAALAMIDARHKRPSGPRTLDAKERPERPTKRKTLRGD